MAHNATSRPPEGRAANKTTKSQSTEDLALNKPARPSEYVATVEEAWGHKASHRLAVLRLLRPSPGALSPSTVIPKRVPAARQTMLEPSRINTRGLDALIITLRQLYTFGYDCVPTQQLSASDSVIFDVAVKDIGWDRTEDYKAKGMIYQFFSSATTIEFPNYTYDQLLGMAPGLIAEHPMFQFYDRNWYSKAKAEDTCWQLEQGLPKFPLGVIPWSGKKSLRETIMESFLTQGDNGSYHHFFSRMPLFLRVRYTAESGSPRSFREMREIDLDLPMRIQQADELWRPSKSKAGYNICAVIRMAVDSLNDDVRTYWNDGHEVAPAEIGHFTNTDEEAAKDPRWTVQSTGVFELFYRLRPRSDETEIHEDEKSEIDNAAPEYEDRNWVREQREL